MKLQLKNITPEAFGPYGAVLDFPPEKPGGFHIIVRDEGPGWRLAVLGTKNHSMARMENHPTSQESFEPLTGMGVLVVAENGSPERYEAFLLDKPVCLFKGIWHEFFALSAEASVKIAENLEVTSEYYHLPKPLTVFVGEEG